MTLRVGITVSIDRGKRIRPAHDYYYLKRAYAERVSETGALPLLLGLDARAIDVAELCDALIISGGDDLPQSAHALEFAGAGDRAEDPARIAWERELIDLFAQREKPLLGICYGMQLINLHFGGTLYTDLRKERDTAYDHGGSGSVNHHEIELIGTSAILTGIAKRVSVNSNHRQAVATPASNFRVTARSYDDVVEAMERGRVFGVQWHPETDPNTASLFTTFIALARNLE
jgi:gamma-glutamyl-gamma-aminobutyrate hydrolase PuuD